MNLQRPSSFTSLLFHFLSLLFMALLTFTPQPSSEKPKKHRKKHQQQHKQKQPSSSSWDQIKNLLTCKQVETTSVHDPSKNNNNNNNSKIGSSSYCKSICSFKDVVHGNTRVVHRSDDHHNSSPIQISSSKSNSNSDTLGSLINKKKSVRHHHQSSSSRSRSSSLGSSVRSNGGGASNYVGCSSRGMQFRKLSGCYECHTIVDPTRYPLPRTTICACSECGEVFPKIESLEHHQAIKHAVSALGPEDSSRNIVEIIFKSSWLKKDNPICKIERILKVHNTQKTIKRFEDCREAVKIHANSNNKKNARCAADGNELLRFHCTTFACSLGGRGSTNLCGSIPGCGVCTIIRHGFQGNKASGVCTTASSGRAHDCISNTDGRRAMLVCRVIAGRVKHMSDNTTIVEDSGLSTSGLYDSEAGYSGIYANLEELRVFNPRAILPCFVVLYKALET